MGIANEGTGGGDKVLAALLKLLFCLLGSADNACAGNRDAYDALYLLCQILSPARLKGGRLKPVAVRVVAGGGDIYCVNAQLLETLCYSLAGLDGVALAGHTDFFIHLIGGQTHHEGIISTALGADTVDYLGDEAHTVFKAAAVLVLTLVCVRGQKLLNDVAVTAVQLNDIDARLLAAHRSLDEIVYKVLDLAAAHLANAHCAVVCKLTLVGCLHRPKKCFLLELIEYWSALIDAVEHLWEAVNDGNYHGQRVNGAGIALSAGMMELDTQLCAVLVYSLGKLTHGLDMVIVAHCKLSVSRCCAVIVYTGNAGDDETDAALCAFLVICHQLFGGLAVCLTEADLRRRHDGAVFHCHGTDVHRRQQHFIAHDDTSFLIYTLIFIIQIFLICR